MRQQMTAGTIGWLRSSLTEKVGTTTIMRTQEWRSMVTAGGNSISRGRQSAYFELSGSFGMLWITEMRLKRKPPNRPMLQLDARHVNQIQSWKPVAFRLAFFIAIDDSVDRLKH